MHISAIKMDGAAGWPTVEFTATASAINVVYGPALSGKSTIANLLAHGLFGKQPAALTVLGQRVAPAGEVTVESANGRYRVRRYHERGGPIRLTLAALDGTSAEPETMHKLVRGLSPNLLAPLCAVSFREAPDARQLLSEEYARQWRAAFGGDKISSERRTAEFVARRDVLAHELETRIASERRVSKELEARSREIERSLRDAQQQAATIEQRLNAAEIALAETDARLRYRRLELNSELQWQTVEVEESPSTADELDAQLARWRQVIGELAQRESDVRARLGQIQSFRLSPAAATADQLAWLAMARQLSADLTGEVARLARAVGSAECVCRDAHPRLRPIAETIDRQLGAMETLINQQNYALEAAELSVEIDHLSSSQEQLRRQVEHLLERRAAIGGRTAAPSEEAEWANTRFSAADAAQLEARRNQLEQERFALVERLRNQTMLVQDFQAQRSAVERQRAALLSARSIEHVQWELAAVQQKLERSAHGGDAVDAATTFDDTLCMASEFLAKLTSGDLSRLVHGDMDGNVHVLNRNGEALAIESFTETQRDQLYISACLALLTSASRQGLWLPLVLDEPFEHFDSRATAALAAVLDDFSRQGHQLIVFTSERTAAERLASLGALVHDVLSLRDAKTISGELRERETLAATTKRRRTKRATRVKRNVSPQQPTNNETPEIDRSDAA